MLFSSSVIPQSFSSWMLTWEQRCSLIVFILTTLKKRHVIDKGGRQGGYLNFSTCSCNVFFSKMRSLSLRKVLLTLSTIFVPCFVFTLFENTKHTSMHWQTKWNTKWMKKLVKIQHHHLIEAGLLQQWLVRLRGLGIGQNLKKLNNAKYSFDQNGATYIFHFDHLPIFSHFNFSSALWLLGEDMLENVID